MYVVGETGILEELDLKGISYIGGPADADKKIELKPGFYLEHDKDVCVVFCGVFVVYLWCVCGMLWMYVYIIDVYVHIMDVC